MNVIEQLRGIRAGLPPASDEQLGEARSRLMAAIERERAPRRETPRRRLRRMARPRVLAAVFALVAVPSGLALAGAFDGSEVTTPSTPASECPEATAAFERAGLPPPEEYVPDCPSRERVQEVIAKERADVELRQRLEEQGVFSGN